MERNRRRCQLDLHAGAEEHELHVRLDPGTRTVVSSATLSPPSFDVAPAVVAARARGQDGLSVLVSLVVQRLDALP